MRRRDMFKVAGAGLLAPLLPEAKADVVVPSPKIITQNMNGENVRLPVIRYDGNFVDCNLLEIITESGGVLSTTTPIARTLRAVVNAINTYTMKISEKYAVLVLMDRSNYYDFYDYWRITFDGRRPYGLRKARSTC